MRSKQRDYEAYRLLVELWVKENPVKTNKFQVLLLVNALFLIASHVTGGLGRDDWPICLGGVVFSLVWLLSIGRTVMFQKIWGYQIKKLAGIYLRDVRFQVLNKRRYRDIPSTLRLFGGVPSSYYLIGAPCVFSLIWLGLLVYFLFRNS